MWFLLQKVNIKLVLITPFGYVFGIPPRSCWDPFRTMQLFPLMETIQVTTEGLSLNLLNFKKGKDQDISACKMRETPAQFLTERSAEKG